MSIEEGKCFFFPFLRDRFGQNSVGQTKSCEYCQIVLCSLSLRITTIHPESICMHRHCTMAIKEALSLLSWSPSTREHQRGHSTGSQPLHLQFHQPRRRTCGCCYSWAMDQRQPVCSWGSLHPAKTNLTSCGSHCPQPPLPWRLQMANRMYVCVWWGGDQDEVGR